MPQQGASDIPEQPPAPEPLGREEPVRSPGPRRARPDVSDAPPVRARRGLWEGPGRLLRAPLVAPAVVLVLIAGFAANVLLGGPGTAEYAARRTGYSPRGTGGDWLNTDYANGYASWTTDGTVLGVAADWATVLVQFGDSTSQDEGTGPLAGLDAATGARRWQAGDLRCMGRDAVLDGSVYCARRTEGGPDQIIGVDMATGRQRIVYETVDELSYVQVHGEYDGELILTEADGADAQRVLAIGPDGALDWQLVLPWWGQCRFLAGHLGCVSYADSQVAVVDLASAGYSLEATEYDHSGERLSVEWAWDGFATNGAGDETARRIFDLSGADLGAVGAAGSPGYGSDRLLYSRDDLRTSGPRTSGTGVDADGRVVAVRSGGGIRMLPSRRVIDAGSIELISSDGSMVLARTYNHGGRVGEGDSWAIYSGDGTKLQDMPRFSSIVGGLLVDEAAGATTVHAPTR